MSLRTKVTLLLVVSFGTLALILLGTAVGILLPSYVQLERDYLRRDTTRAIARLNYELDTLGSLLTDWASWDDSYDFVARPNEAYVTSNLVDSTFANTNLTALIMADNRRVIVYDGFYDYRQEMALANMPALEAILYEPETGLLRPEFVEPTQGLVLLPEGLLLVAIRPILNSEETLPTRGTMIMGRLLDEALLTAMAEDVQADVSLFSWAEAVAVLPVQTTGWLANEKDPTAVSLIVVSKPNNRINSYSLLTDIYGTPAAVLNISTDRAIYQSGQNTLLTFFIATISMGLLVVLVAVYLLSTQIINRVVALEQGVVYVREQDDLTHLLPTAGNDEIASLGQQINRLLAALDLARHVQRATEQSLLEEHNQLEVRVHERTQALAAANEALRQLDLSKTQFINDLSHEFRTPVTNLRLYLDLWQRGNEAQKERYLQVLDVQITRLIKLTESVMRLAELEFAGDIIERQVVDLEGLVRPLVRQYQATAVENGLTFSHDIEPGLFLLGQVDLLQTLLTELLENTICYSEQGHIQLTAQAYTAENDDKTEQTDWVKITLVDEGIGIVAEDLPHIYERFYRGRGASQSNRPGIGVGLTIVGHIVALHHGRVQIQSEVGVGTAVVLYLPRADIKKTHLGFCDQVR